jgi:hypothetical protein
MPPAGPEGRPVAIRVFPGNIGDPSAFTIPRSPTMTIWVSPDFFRTTSAISCCAPRPSAS